MFDIGMSELLVVAVVAIVVVGPKDLPGLLRTAARYMGQLRSMARDFQGQVNEAIKESELDSVRDAWKDVKNLDPANQLKSEVSDYMESARALDVPDDGDFSGAKTPAGTGEAATGTSAATLVAANDRADKAVADDLAADKPAENAPATEAAPAAKRAAGKTSS